MTLRSPGWRGFLAAAAAGAAALPAARADDPLVLAEGGRSEYVLVLPADALPAERRAAEELQRHLREISGAELPIVGEADAPPGPAVLLNARERIAAADPDFAKAQPGPDGFRVRARGRDLLILGDRPRGALYAVSALLEERLGCRWFTPTLSRVPKQGRVALDASDMAYDPPLEYRESYFHVVFNPDWAGRNRMNGQFTGLTEAHGGAIVYQPFCHSFNSLVPPERHYNAHPEYFAEIRGKRERDSQLCLTNPEVLRLVIDGVRRWAREQPQARILSVTQNDNVRYCRCAGCRAVDEREGSPSGTMLAFVNAVAEAVEAKFPDVAIDTFAYQYTRKPPKTLRPRRNVIVRLCSIECCFAHPLETCPKNAAFREDLLGWSMICDRLYVWDYVTNFPHYHQPHPNLDVLGPNIGFYIRHGVRGIFEQGNYHGPGEMSELRAYLAAKALWNPAADLVRARDEFLEAYYGPAAGAVREYLEMLHARVRDGRAHAGCFEAPKAAYLQGDFLARAGRIFDEAERRAGGDADVLARVRRARFSPRYAGAMRVPPGPARATVADALVAERLRAGAGPFGEGVDDAAWRQKYLHATPAASAPPAGAAPDPPTTHDPGLVLFVDDHWIAGQSGLTRVLGAPQVLPEPILYPERLETDSDCAWGNVIREPDGRYRLWYVTMTGSGHGLAAAGVWGRGEDFSFHPRSDADVREVEIMLGKVAESDDGVHWRKPALGHVALDRRRDPNVVLTGAAAARQTDGALTNFDGFTVLRDDAEADSTRRYKMLAHWESVHFWDNHPASGSLGRPQAAMDRYGAARGKYLTTSPDGLRWDQPLERLQTIDGFGDRCLVVRDHRHRRWWLNNRPPGGYGAAGLSTSENAVGWNPTEPHLAPDPKEFPDGHPAIESLIPFNYGSQDLGFLITQVKDATTATLLAYLVSHHDGEPWRRIGRVPGEPFIPAGEPWSYFATGAVPLHNEPMIRGDRLLVYFNAFAYTDVVPPQGRRTIGLAVLRRDGFAGLTPVEAGGGAPATGTLRTRTVAVSGPRLYLNVEMRGDGGRVEVALLDPGGTPLPGCGLEDTVPDLARDAVRLPVAWNEHGDLRELAGKEVAVQIRLTGPVVLYALAFGP